MTKPTERPVLIMVTAGGRNDAERLGEDLVVEHLAEVALRHQVAVHDEQRFLWNVRE